MAPALQCPDCSTKHPLDGVPEAGTFGCRGCGRMLKVPGSRPAAPVAPPPAPAPTPVPPVVPSPAATPDPGAERVLASAVAGSAAASASTPPTVGAPDATAVLPEVDDPMPPRRTEKRRVAWWLVLCLWIVAVPAGFLIVFLVARLTGLFTSDQLSDIFLASGFDRFWPLARLVPLVALVTALIVQIGVAALARRTRPRAQPDAGDAPAR